MRTTVRLDETLMREVKSYAARHQRTFTSVLEDALRRLLKEEDMLQTTERIDVVVYTGAGLRPGVDLDDRTTWQPLIDAEDAERFTTHADA
ncbi:hypothetical protein [Haloechinothrix halophila]|uniref:hypothetical protein n=1 Tax=Haloechinothrix halophila TaxID=1069073 RepID=UPI0012FBF979|nr:hypothetical protein [Haloechinothrix halophila]